MYESLGQRFDGFVLYLGMILTSGGLWFYSRQQIKQNAYNQHKNKQKNDHFEIDRTTAKKEFANRGAQDIAAKGKTKVKYLETKRERERGERERERERERQKARGRIQISHFNGPNFSYLESTKRKSPKFFFSAKKKYSERK